MEGTTTSDSPRSARGGRPRRSPLLGERAIRSIERHLMRRERRREELFEESQRLRRAAQGAMARLHEGRSIEAEIRSIERGARALARRGHRKGRGEAGLAHDALQEAVEAILLDRVVRGEPFPSPEDLGVPPEEYLAGLGDLAGEVRRLALAALSQGSPEEARRRLAEMESILGILLRFETPRSIVPLKPKQDSARALVERTRGDVTLAEVLHRAGLKGRPEAG
ncbi:MAG TPA: hypothetical protein VGV64_05485 [Thermoplasmata archaeon]|nr:hypothetical protein [Thermoplasmata archaeon]